MTDLKWITEKRKISDLKLFEGNPRKMTEIEAENLMSSLKKFNLAEIPAIDTKNRILAGNMRITALKKLGRGDEEIDVRVPDRELTEEEAREYLLRSNRNTGQWDYDLLANFGEDELMTSGFESEEIDQVFNEETTEDDFDAESEYAKTETDIKAGDLFQLGTHRLLCGDATKREDIEKLMGGEKADMVFTDPPYNVNYKGTKFDKIKNDAQTEEDFIKFSEEFVARIKETLKEGGVYYICSGYASYPPFLYAIKINGLHFSVPIIWVKNYKSFKSFADYKTKQEMILRGRKDKKKKALPIMYGWNNGKHYFVDDPQEADVWEIKCRAGNAMVHPTQKPLELIGRAIRNSSKRGELILDLFGGSGSTLISAEKEGRKCFIMELDEKYCQVIINRFEKFTGVKTVKIN